MVVVFLSIAVIAFGGAFWFYEAFLDGTIINPIVTHDMPLADGQAIPIVGTFQPSGSTIIESYQMKTDRMEYTPGDYIYGFVSVCLYRKIQPIAQWTFVNDIAQALAPRLGNIMLPGCYSNIKVPIATVPDEFRSAFPGSQYRLYGEITYTVNPFRKISYTFITNSFTIDQSTSSPEQMP
jgi:hypothetical protein